MANTNVYGRLTDELQVKSAVYSHPLYIPPVCINHRQHYTEPHGQYFALLPFKKIFQIISPSELKLCF